MLKRFKLSLCALLAASAFANAELPQTIDPNTVRQLIADDNYVNTFSPYIISRMAEIKQKPSVVQNVHKYLPFVVNKMVIEKQPYQLVEFFDFYCMYCKDAIPAVYKMLESQKDIGIGYFVLLHENSPKELVYAAFGLTKVAIEKQQTYLSEMFDLLFKNTVTSEQVVTLLKQYDISFTEEEIKIFSDSQMKLTKSLYEDLNLQGTPTFVLLKNGQPIADESLEVLLGTANLEYFDIYKSKIK